MDRPENKNPQTEGKYTFEVMAGWLGQKSHQDPAEWMTAGRRKGRG